MMNPLSKTHLLGLSLAGLLFASCSTRETVVADYQVVPMPLETVLVWRHQAKLNRYC